MTKRVTFIWSMVLSLNICTQIAHFFGTCTHWKAIIEVIMFLDISLIYFKKCKSNYEQIAVTVPGGWGDGRLCRPPFGSFNMGLHGARHRKFQKTDWGKCTKQVGCKVCARGPSWMWEHWVTAFHPSNFNHATLKRTMTCRVKVLFAEVLEDHSPVFSFVFANLIKSNHQIAPCGWQKK